MLRGCSRDLDLDPEHRPDTGGRSTLGRAAAKDHGRGMAGGHIHRERSPTSGTALHAHEQPTASRGPLAGAVLAYPVVAFFVLAYALAWAYWVPLALAHHGWFSLPWTTHLPGLTAPLLAAIIVTWATERTEGLRDLVRRMVQCRIEARWTLVAVSPLVFFAAIAGVMTLTGSGPTADALGRFDGIGDLGVPGLLAVLIVVNGIGEEAGWRGYAHHHLHTGDDPRRAVGIVALLWASWHLPLFFFHEGFRELPVYALPGWLIGIGAGAVVLAWLYERSGCSILAVAVWHGTYNWAAATDAADGAIGAVVTAAVILAALWLTRHGDFTPKPCTHQVPSGTSREEPT